MVSCRPGLRKLSVCEAGSVRRRAPRGGPGRDGDGRPDGTVSRRGVLLWSRAALALKHPGRSCRRAGPNTVGDGNQLEAFAARSAAVASGSAPEPGGDRWRHRGRRRSAGSRWPWAQLDQQHADAFDQMQEMGERSAAAASDYDTGMRRAPPLPCRPVPSRRRPTGELVAQGGLDGTEAHDLEKVAAAWLVCCWPSCCWSVPSKPYPSLSGYESFDAAFKCASCIKLPGCDDPIDVLSHCATISGPRGNYPAHRPRAYTLR